MDIVTLLTKISEAFSNHVIVGIWRDIHRRYRDIAAKDKTKRRFKYFSRDLRKTKLAHSSSCLFNWSKAFAKSKITWKSMTMKFYLLFKLIHFEIPSVLWSKKVLYIFIFINPFVLLQKNVKFKIFYRYYY